MSDPRLVKLRALVLASRPAGEADKLLTLYSDALGKIRARAVSAGRTTAKLLGATEPFVESELMVFLRPESPWGKITGGRVLRCHPALYATWVATAEASYLCEVLDRLVPDRQASPIKFELLRQALAQVAAGPHPAVRWAFVLRLLELAGFGLQLTGCVRCGATGRALWLVPEVGGYLCEVHAGGRTRGTLISPAVQERLRGLAGDPWDVCRAKPWSSEATEFFERLLDQCLTTHLTRPLKSAQFRGRVQAGLGSFVSTKTTP